MRPIIYLIIIAAAVYLIYPYIEKNGGRTSESETPSETIEEVRKAPARLTPAAPSAPVKTALPFKSKIVISGGAPGEKHLAKPGIFYVLERTSIEHETGIAAVVPGEEVRVLTRKGNGIVKVTTGKYDFELKESQLTNDLDAAQEAERKFVLTHPPARQQ